jgi:RNA polymerase sigma factor (sigma-70 family)
MSIVLECPCEGVARFACAQTGCRVCMDALLREHSGLVYWMVKHQAAGKTAYADLLQEGRIGLWQAIKHYEVGRGVAFSSYACVVIRHQVWQRLRQEQKAVGWLEAAGREDDLERVVRVWQQAQVQQALEAELEVLPENLRGVIELHYGLCGAVPQNLAQIGRGWGLTRERIRQLHAEALALLRLPALSIRLRSLCEHQAVSHYRETLRQHQIQQRALRRQR